MSRNFNPEPLGPEAGSASRRPRQGSASELLDQANRHDDQPPETASGIVGPIPSARSRRPDPVSASRTKPTPPAASASRYQAIRDS